MRVVALLDKPSSDSFGMCAIVIQDGKHLTTTGFASGKSKHLSETALADLVCGGHALEVDLMLHEYGSHATKIPGIRLSEKTNSVALWVGQVFAAKTRHYVDVPDTYRVWPHDVCVDISNDKTLGTFAIMPPQDAYGYLDAWLKATLKYFWHEAKGPQRKEISGLMQALPDRIETLAVAWCVAEDQDKELEMQRKTFAKHLTVTQLIARHNAVFEELRRVL